MSLGIHQVLGGAGPWDAITNHALEAREVIRSMGYRSEIFADNRHISIAVAHEVHPHDAWPILCEPRDAAILHYSIDSPAFVMALDHASTIGMHYHNVTPPELLWRDAPGVALQCKTGIQGLRRISPRIGHAAAVSHFNADEMREAGFADPAVIGILRSDLPRATRRRMNGRRTRMLFVGRGIPNKRQDALILGLAALDDAGVDAELHLVGGWGACRPYLERCTRLAEDLGVLERVTFTGPVDDAALAQEYADADVFVCLSQHEGYCVPIIEALAHDLPVVALRAGAVPETLGAAGLLIDDLTPSTVAEAIAIARDAAGDAFADARRAQIEAHSREATTERLRDFISELSAAC